jgi:hypothetical protein
MIALWKAHLLSFLTWYEDAQRASPWFVTKLFLLFFLLNFACFWLALSTAYPQYLSGDKAVEYQLMSIPVGMMGALFDTLSLFITIWMIRRAIKTKHLTVYLGYLSIDFVIAIIATFWVLFAFIASGWVVNLVLENPETFNQRTALYESRVDQMFADPFSAGNLKNMYFGFLMGASAFIPTLVHIGMALLSLGQWLVGIVIGSSEESKKADAQRIN